MFTVSHGWLHRRASEVTIRAVAMTFSFAVSEEFIVDLCAQDDGLGSTRAETRGFVRCIYLF
jgi:hypothetical protein